MAAIPTETLGTLRGRIRLRLQDPNARLWTDADLNQFINLACADLQQRTQWLEDWYGTVLETAVRDYPRNSDVIENMRYQIFDTTRIDAISAYMLDQYKPDWRQDADGLPTRVYRRDWNVDSLQPPPNGTGQTFSDSQELGIVVAIQDSASLAYVTTDNQQLGETQTMFDPSTPDDFFFSKSTYADPNSQWGIDVSCVSPYLNLISVFSRYPDALANDADVVPFPVYAHYALEEFALGLSFSKEGDGNNLKLAQAHQRMYALVWVPFLFRMINNRTPDHPLIWRGQDPADPHVANYSAVTPSWTGIQGR